MSNNPFRIWLTGRRPVQLHRIGEMLNFLDYNLQRRPYLSRTPQNSHPQCQPRRRIFFRVISHSPMCAPHNRRFRVCKGPISRLRSASSGRFSSPGMIVSEGRSNRTGPSTCGSSIPPASTTIYLRATTETFSCYPSVRVGYFFSGDRNGVPEVP